MWLTRWQKNKKKAFRHSQRDERRSCDWDLFLVLRQDHVAVAGVGVASVSTERWRPSLQRHSDQPLLGSDVGILCQQVNPIVVTSYIREYESASFSPLSPSLLSPPGLAATRPGTWCASGPRSRPSPRSRSWSTGSSRVRAEVTTWLCWSCPTARVTVWPSTPTPTQHASLPQTEPQVEVLHLLVLSWLPLAGQEQVGVVLSSVCCILKSNGMQLEIRFRYDGSAWRNTFIMLGFIKSHAAFLKRLQWNVVSWMSLFSCEHFL